MAAPAPEQIVQEIKHGSHWRFVARPSRYDPDRVASNVDGAELVDKRRVSLRGWDCPCVEPAGPEYGSGWTGSTTEYGLHREHWRLYHSGQFVHLCSYEEDLWIEQGLATPRFAGAKLLWIVSAVYRLTEYLLFVSGLAADHVYDDGIVLSLTLTGTMDRHLAFSEGRRSLFQDYRCHDEPLSLPDRTLAAEELIATAPQVALGCALEIFRRFGWSQPPIDVLREDQRKLIERRL